MVREITYLEAVREAMTQEMERDERVFLIGEDVGKYGGAFQVSYGMLEKFGPERILDTPITELGIAGAATGAVGILRRGSQSVARTTNAASAATTARLPTAISTGFRMLCPVAGSCPPPVIVFESS